MDGDAEQTRRLEQRLEIVQGLIVAVTYGGALVDAIKACDSRVSAYEMLQADPWNFTETVASHVLDTPYGRTTRRGFGDLESEAEELQRQLDIT